MYLIGYIIKPQGVKGEVKVEPVSPYPERYKGLNSVYIQIANHNQSYPIENVRIADRFVYIKFAGINSRDEAEFLRDAEILIKGEDLIQPSENEYFIHDLIGCCVRTDDNEELGEIIDVVQMSSNDIYVVKNHSGKEVLIPAVKEFVLQVDLELKEIRVHLLEGLID